MKILHISFMDPNATTGGAMAVKRNSISLRAIFGDENVTFRKVETYPKKTVMNRIGKLWKQLTKHSYYLNEWDCIEDASKFDCVFIDSSRIGYMAHLLRKKEYKGTIVVYFHNDEYRLAMEESGSKRSPFARLFISNIKYSEEAALRFADSCMFICQRDMNDIVEDYQINPCNPTIIPMTLNDSVSEADDETVISDVPTLTFVGSYFHPNVYGCRWFIENVMPHVNCKFRIVGKDMDKLRKHISIPDSVELHSSVPDLHPFIEDSDCMVYPIFHGSGMKVKTCEALMYGKNIIGTDEAFNGYDVDYPKVGACCNTASEFIDAIKKLGGKRRYNKDSREAYLEKYSIDATTELLRNQLRRLLDSPRVLVVAGQVYNESYVKAGGRITGLGVMLKDIYSGVGAKGNCRMMVTGIPLKTGVSDGMMTYSVLDGKTVFRRLTLVDFFLIVYALIKGEKPKAIKDKLIARKSAVIMDKVLREWSPKIVNFHDLSYVNKELIKHCRQRGTKCVATLHLYIGKDVNPHGYRKLQNNESEILPLSGVRYSVVSSGMKSRMMKDYPNIPSSYIYTIVNGSSFIDRAVLTDRRKKILCIGTVSERKNQIQIVNAVKLMNEEERKALQIVFLGEDDKGMLRQEISNANCGEALLFAGKVTLKEMETYYQKAFGTITTSYNEGFGLTVIEGYSKGIPALFFSDLDSANDLYSPDVAISIKARTDRALKDAIIEFVNSNWNKNLIIDFAQRFSMKPVFDKYVDMYNEINVV